MRADRSTLMVFDSGVSLGGLQLHGHQPRRVTGRRRLLNAAPPPPASITAHYLSVPAAYDSLRALALSVVAGRGREDPVRRRPWRCRTGWPTGSFKYTLKAPTVLSAAGLTQFLEVTKKGYCQQFSFAMAVLARLLGIPSRVAYGFTSGTPIGDATPGRSPPTTRTPGRSCTSRATAGCGSSRRRPAPAGQGTAFAPSYSTHAGQRRGRRPCRRRRRRAAGATASRRASGGIPPNLREILGRATSAARRPPPGRGTVSPWEIFGLVVAGLRDRADRPVVRAARRQAAALAPGAHPGDPARRLGGRPVLAPPTGGPLGTAVAVRPQVSVLSAGDRVRARDIAWAHAAWQELRDDLIDYGAGYLPSESPRAVAARAGDGLVLTGTARAALGRIAMAEERARYAPAPADGSGLRRGQRRGAPGASPPRCRAAPGGGHGCCPRPCSARRWPRSHRRPTRTAGAIGMEGSRPAWA